MDARPDSRYPSDCPTGLFRIGGRAWWTSNHHKGRGGDGGELEGWAEDTGWPCHNCLRSCWICLITKYKEFINKCLTKISIIYLWTFNYQTTKKHQEININVELGIAWKFTKHNINPKTFIKLHHCVVSKVWNYLVSPKGWFFKGFDLAPTVFFFTNGIPSSSLILCSQSRLKGVLNRIQMFLCSVQWLWRWMGFKFYRCKHFHFWL